MNTDPSIVLNAIRARLEADALPLPARNGWLRQVERLLAGEAFSLPEADLLPVTDLPSLINCPSPTGTDRQKLIAETAVLKLNGGLGTSMGLNHAKSLLPAKNGFSFLDLIIRQILYLRGDGRVRLPLILMNSSITGADTEAVLTRYPERIKGQDEIPFGFLQHRVPKLRAADLKPAEAPDNPDLAWCPPGHGDLYPALYCSGLLDHLCATGIRYLFVSNSDNLGATLDLNILAYFAKRQLPFLMEVTPRTPLDRKGGHLARNRAGQLLLREIAQCPQEDLNAFQNIDRHRFFNTNNIWIDLRALHDILTTHQGWIDMPPIINRKTLDPRVAESTPVLQIESAMGAAISAFPDAIALIVPRSRFIPVKTTSDLLLLWSDCFQLNKDWTLTAMLPAGDSLPQIELDPKNYRHIAEFTARFPAGAPRLQHCRRLTIEGDFLIEGDVAFEGSVRLTNPHLHQINLPAGIRVASY